MLRLHYILLILLFLPVTVFTQEGFKVQRCADIDRSAPITNIYIDEKGNKWVGDYKGVYLAQSPDYASVVKTPIDKWALLSVRDGNEELTIPIADMRRELGEAFDQINTAHFDKSKKELWVGTTELGAFRLQTQPSLKLIEEVNSSNSKLKSDFINTIYIRANGEIWLGSDEGALVGSAGKWRLVEKFFAVLRIAENANKMYLLSDGQVLEVDSRDKSFILTIEEDKTEGEVKDIAFDSKGRLWIASEIVTRFDLENRAYETFGPAREFTSQFVNCIAVDADDAAWVGTDDKGVYFIGAESTLTIDSEVIKALSCQDGASDAVVSVRVSGGAPPYTFNWNDKSLSGDRLENVGAGNYAVTVSDTEGNEIKSAVVIEDLSIVLDIKQTTEASNGEADGVATVSAERGIGGDFTYKWDNGETTATAKKLAVGKHEVTVSDQSGCKSVGTITISEGVSELKVEVEKVVAINCPGETNATLQATARGGQKPYTYRWSNDNLKGDNPKDIGAGIYQVFVTDALGNKATANIEVDEPKALQASANVVDAAAAGAENGKAELQVSGGTGNYSYQWDSGATTSTANNLSGGEHSATITDANGCSTTTTFNMTEDASPMVLTLTQTEQINCAGDANASITATVEGGAEPFKYYWNGQPANKSVARLPAAEYIVKVTDAAGNTVTETINVIAPDELVATAEVESMATTNNEDGRATVSITGGTEPYTYAWDNEETTATATQLAPTAHTVTVTDSRGCTAEATIDISEDIQDLTVSIDATQEMDCDGNGAALSVSVKGGKAPFTYNWSEANLTGETASDLSAGDYAVTVTDAAGTTQNATFTIKAPVAVAVTVQQKTPASTGGEDGQAEAKAQGGTGSYIYVWDNGETNATAENLSAGSHGVTITDENGCTASAEIDISEDILPLSAEINITKNIDCATASNAALSVSTNGGKAPFTYQWSDDNITGESAENLAAGTYSVTISDAVGATQTAEIAIEAPTPLTVTITAKSPASTGNADGKAEAKVDGGTGSYTYSWDNGTNTATAKNLAPGTRSVTITDENGCTASAEIDISEDILPLVATTNLQREIDCQGANTAAVTIDVNGGKAPFTYAWDKSELEGASANNLAAGTYNVVVTDATGTDANLTIEIEEPDAINAVASVSSPASTGNADGVAVIKAEGGAGGFSYEWDNGENKATAKKLAPGVHSVTVTDKNGCSVESSVEISEDILPLTVTIEQTQDLDCNGAASAVAQVTVRGGKQPFEYAWNDSNLKGENINQLAAGNYELTVTDVEGTTQTATILIKEPTALSASAKVNASASTDNEDGKATVKADGGTGKYTYLWSNGETTAAAEKLAPTNHTVTVTDENGCTTTAEVSITEDILPLAVTLTETGKINCSGESTAGLKVDISGGKQPFSTQWNQNNLSGENPTNLIGGTYAVTVTDATGTTATAMVNVVEPEPLELTATVISAANTNATDGRATAVATGGSGEFNYQWDNGETAAAAQNLAPGKHSITVTDSNGCTANVAIDISEDVKELAFGFRQTTPIECAGATSAGLSVEVTGGKSPFTYQWNDSSLSGAEVSNLGAGNYAVTVTDASGQSLNAAIDIEEPASLSLEVLRSRPAFDAYEEDGLAEVKAVGGTAPYTIAWDTEETGTIAKKLKVGDHTVTVTDAKGCSATETVTIKKKLLQALQAGRLRAGQTLQLKNLNFPADSTDMTAESLPILDEVREFLQDNPTITIEVGGHTNSTPPDDYCDRLSTARAKNVATYILGGSDVAGDRISYVGYGKRKPIATNKTEDGRRRNQRVEIKVLTL